MKPWVPYLYRLWYDTSTDRTQDILCLNSYVTWYIYYASMYKISGCIHFNVYDLLPLFSSTF